MNNLWSKPAKLLPLAIISLVILSACNAISSQPLSQGICENPNLPAPHHSLIATINIAPAIGRPADKKPVAIMGTQVAFAKGMFVGQHGSWNRKPSSGYKVIFISFKNGQPDGQPIDVLTGFLSDQGDAYGRPA